MSRKPIGIDIDASIASAAKIMEKNNISGLIVWDKEKKLAGIITEGDLIRRAFLKKKSPTRTKVKEIMTKKVITVGPDDDIYKLVQLMNQKGIRKIPVVEDKKVVGYVTEKDLLKVEPELLDVLIEKLKVKCPEEFKLSYLIKQ